MGSKYVKYVDSSTDAKAPTYSVSAKAPTYTQASYKSKYGNQIASALDSVVNRESFSYDPLKDASYQALAKIYTKRGEQAAKNTLGDVAALNGGLGSSYATSAAQQTRNDYNQELASLIPDLEEKAYSRYADNFNMNVSALGALQDAEETEYGKYRDTVSDNQWKYGVDYDKYRDSVSDTQWKYSQDYQKYRDEISDSQWAKNYNLDVYELKKAKSGSSGSRSSSGGGGYSGGSTSDSWLSGIFSDASTSTTSPKKTTQKVHGKVKASGSRKA